MLFASYFHDISSIALPVSLLHRCFSQAISMIVLHSTSPTSSPPMLSASYFHDFSFIALPVPLFHRCFPQAISRVFLPVPLLQRRVSQAISTIFPPDTFPAVFRTHFTAPKRALRYRGAPGSETKREPKHRRCFWEKEIKIEKWHLRKMTGPQEIGSKAAHTMSHTPLGIRRAGCCVLLCISQTPEMHPRPFFLCFWHPRWSFARVVGHPHGHPQASAPFSCTC